MSDIESQLNEFRIDGANSMRKSTVERYEDTIRIVGTLAMNFKAAVMGKKITASSDPLQEGYLVIESVQPGFTEQSKKSISTYKLAVNAAATRLRCHQSTTEVFSAACSRALISFCNGMPDTQPAMRALSGLVDYMGK